MRLKIQNKAFPRLALTFLALFGDERDVKCVWFGCKHRECLASIMAFRDLRFSHIFPLLAIKLLMTDDFKKATYENYLA